MGGSGVPVPESDADIAGAAASSGTVGAAMGGGGAGAGAGAAPAAEEEDMGLKDLFKEPEEDASKAPASGGKSKGPNPEEGFQNKLYGIIHNPQSSAAQVKEAQKKLKKLFPGKDTESMIKDATENRKTNLESAAKSGDEKAYENWRSEKKAGTKWGRFKGFVGGKIDKVKGFYNEHSSLINMGLGALGIKMPGGGDKEGGGEKKGGGSDMAATISDLYQENKRLKDELAKLKGS
jgi:hypothetical protein